MQAASTSRAKQRVATSISFITNIIRLPRVNSSPAHEQCPAYPLYSRITATLSQNSFYFKFTLFALVPYFLRYPATDGFRFLPF